MGLGHVIRSLAVVEMIKSEFDCYFVIKNPLPFIRNLIQASCAGMVELPDSMNGTEEAIWWSREYLTGAEVVLLDGYHFGTEYQRVIKNNGNKLISIDDVHNCHFVADAIINHAGGAKLVWYSKESHSQLYLGTQYALLRAPFLEAARQQTNKHQNKAVFVCFGGADPNNDTIDVLQRCEKQHGIEKCYVVIGGAYEHKEALEAFALASNLQIEVLSNLTAHQMATTMQKCPIAICSPSSVSYEYLSVGGTLYLHPIADNQKDIFNFLINSGLAFSLNDFPQEDTDLIAQATEYQASAFDGKSGRRILKIFRKLAYDQLSEFRHATINDLMTYFLWANDPLTRKHSYNTAPIPLDQHRQWFLKKLIDANSFLYLLEIGNEPVGQVRFDFNEDATLSYVVAPEWRGRGFGSYLIAKGIQQLRKDLQASVKVIGYVKKDNVASNRTFLNLGDRKSVV